MLTAFFTFEHYNPSEAIRSFYGVEGKQLLVIAFLQTETEINQ